MKITSAYAIIMNCEDERFGLDCSMRHSTRGICSNKRRNLLAVIKFLRERKSIERIKNLKLLLCALSGSRAIGGCGDVKNSKSANKQTQSQDKIEKSIESKTEKETEKATEKETAVKIPLHGYDDADKVIAYVEEVDIAITNGTADTDTIRSFLIEQVDFTFYGKDICGIYLDTIDMDQEYKKDFVGGTGRLGNYVNSNYPDIIPSLPENYRTILETLGNNIDQFEAVTLEGKNCSDRLEMKQEIINKYARIFKEN